MSSLVIYLRETKNKDYARRRAPACLMSSEANETTGARHSRLGRSCHRWDWDRQVGKHEVTAIMKFLRGRIAMAELDPATLAICRESLPEGLSVRPIRT